jgi:hypothetical protein
MAIDSATGKEAAGGGGTATVPEWAKSLPPDLAAHPSAAKFKDPGEVFKSYLESEKYLGAAERRLPLMPGPDGKPEEWMAIYDKLGRPKTAEEYGAAQLLKGIKLPEGFSLPEEGFNEFAKMAHTIGMPKQMFERVVQYYAETQAKEYEGLRGQQEKVVNDAETSLRKEWGLSYEQNRGIALKALKVMYGKDAEVMAQQYGHDPAFVRGLHQIGSKLSEDVLGEGGARSYTMTPEQAQGEIKKIQADMTHPVWLQDHPEHKAAKTAWDNLYAMAYPGITDND